MVSVTASFALPVCLLLSLCPSPSVVAVVGGVCRLSLIKGHKGDCCGSSCVWVPSPGRPHRPASHGAGSSCVFCCLSHGRCSIVPQAKGKTSRFPPIFSPSFLKVLNCFCLQRSPSLSISFSCLFNLLFLFFLCFPQSYYFLPLCPWLGCPLSVSSHSSSVPAHPANTERVFLSFIVNP